MKSLLDHVLINELMTRTPISIESQQSMHLADARMSARGLQHLPVVDQDNTLLGLVSHRDIVAEGLSRNRRHARATGKSAVLRDTSLERPLESLMTRDVVALTSDMSVRVGIAHLLRSRHGFAPVLEDMTLVGVLTEDDILRFCVRYFRSSPFEVADIMSRELITAKGDTTLAAAAQLMQREDIHHLLVSNHDGRLAGVVSHRDIVMMQRSVSEAGEDTWRIEQIATTNAWTTTSNTTVREAAQTLIDNHFGCLPVVEARHLLGIITLSDFLKAMLADDDKRTPTEVFIAPCAAYASQTVCRVAPEQSIARALQCFSQFTTSTLLVVEQDRAVGVLSHKDVLAAMHASEDTEAILASPVSQFMSRELVRIDGNRNVGEAAAMLTQHRVHQVVVERENAEPSLLGTSEIFQAVRDKRLQTPLREIMSCVIFSIDANEAVKSARRYLRQAALSGLVVHDGSLPVGVFGPPEALASLALPEERLVEVAMCSKILCLASTMPVWRVAQQAEALGARHIIVQDGGETVGLATATDFAGLLAALEP